MACAKVCFVEKLLRNADQGHLVKRFIGQGYVTVLDMTLLTNEELEWILFVKESKVRELIISAGEFVLKREYNYRTVRLFVDFHV